ncbi:MAG: hypothetical protein EXR70_13370 [Deltaproteobacteria bacterium]|nr:hypothetical protein [Deltaproteobacteria bacterium]
MTGENLDIVNFFAPAIILMFLIAIAGDKKQVGVFKALVTGSAFSNEYAVDRMFEEQHLPSLKKCPNCAEQLPLSGVICEACDYNFLSGMVGNAKRLLAPSQTPIRMLPKQRAASRS